MVRQQLVDAATFLTSKKAPGIEGDYLEPNEELTFRRYLSSLVAHVQSHMNYEQPDLEDCDRDDSDDN